MENNRKWGMLNGLGKLAADNKHYHNAKKLLEIYREVSWGLQYNLNEFCEECSEMGYGGIEEAMEFMEDGSIDSKAIYGLQDRALSMRVTRLLAGITENALMALRDYPDKGEQYFNILNHTYVSRYPLSEGELLEDLNVSRSTLYRMKKRALSMLGAIIWGYMIPQIIYTQSA